MKDMGISLKLLFENKPELETNNKKSVPSSYAMWNILRTLIKKK
jgi:hypothetical protein